MKKDSRTLHNITVTTTNTTVENSTVTRFL